MFWVKEKWIQLEDENFLPTPEALTWEGENKKLEKYMVLGRAAIKPISVMRKSDNNALLIDDMNEDDNERVNILMALCDGLDKEEATIYLEETRHNIEEAEKLFRKNHNGVPQAQRTSSMVSVTFNLPRDLTFQRSYSSELMIWEIGQDIYEKTKHQDEFSIFIKETSQTLSLEEMLATPFSTLPANVTFVVLY